MIGLKTFVRGKICEIFSTKITIAQQNIFRYIFESVLNIDNSEDFLKTQQWKNECRLYAKKPQLVCIMALSFFFSNIKWR